MRTLRNILLSASVVIFGAAVSASENLGQTHFPTSGDTAAQEHFLRGLLLLHSFEYTDAREAFREAREIDADFAMAAWGEAMTHSHPLWLQEDLEAAREALDRLAPTAAERLAKAPTAREKAYLNAVEILYGEGDKQTRDNAYERAMAAVAARFPDDLDAAAFHALSILGTCHDGRDTAAYMRAAAVVEEVFAKNPRHPGAAHYLIHSYDDPVHAPLGLRAARLYADIAPSATHALHMPSHIFLALGLWDETATSNEDSWQASLDRAERKGLGVEARSFHALLWLQYAYLQQGRYADARRLLAIAEEDAAKASDSTNVRSHLADMRAYYLIESQRWNEDIPAPDLEGLDLRHAATVLFTDGLTALHRGDLDAARESHAQLRQRRQDVLAEATEGSHCSAGYNRKPEIVTLEAQIMDLQLGALLDLAEERSEEALDKLASATRLEADAPFGFGPPTPPKPSHELYAEVLIELHRPVEALEQVDKALARAPRRARTLLARQRIETALSEPKAAANTRQVLRQIWHRADREATKMLPADAATR